MRVSRIAAFLPLVTFENIDTDRVSLVNITFIQVQNLKFKKRTKARSSQKKTKQIDEHGPYFASLRCGA